MGGTLKSPDELHSMLRDHWDVNYVFRGEDSTQYPLRSKLGRAVARREDNAAKEQDILRQFKRRAAPLLATLPSTNWEWLAIAQHFGLATRLLDWTENPLIAVFFATRNPRERRDRLLYMLPESAIGAADESTEPFDAAVPVFYRPTHIVTRVTSQAGLFTVHPTPSESFAHERLEQWVIPDEIVIDVYATLMTYGITEAFVFADLDALARHLNDRYLL
jgi:hypothetical protein